jgi:hypothetical protein
MTRLGEGFVEGIRALWFVGSGAANAVRPGKNPSESPKSSQWSEQGAGPSARFERDRERPVVAHQEVVVGRDV